MMSVPVIVILVRKLSLLLKAPIIMESGLFWLSTTIDLLSQGIDTLRIKANNKSQEAVVKPTSSSLNPQAVVVNPTSSSLNHNKYGKLPEIPRN